jgi:hypothetical protein
MVRLGKVDYLKQEYLSAVVASISKADWHGDLSERDRLLGWNHSIKWVWAALELILGEPQPLKGVEVHEVEATAPIHEGLSELGCPDQRVDNAGEPSWLRDAIWVVRPIKSDRGLKLEQVL